MIGRLIVKLAYFILAFEPYQNFKKKANDLLNNDKNRYKKYLDSFMITLVITSIIILISDMRHPEHDIWDVFNYYVISFMFLVEYLFRFWVASDNAKIIIAQHEKDTQLQRPFQLFAAFKSILRAKWEYMRKPMAIIDLLAAIPFSNEYGLLRAFVFFRIFKLFRYSKSLQMFGSVLATKRFEFLTIFIFASIIILVSSILFYITEAPSPSSPVETLYAAVYWSIVTMSTVGYGDIVPTTSSGRFIAMIVIFAGVAVLSFVTSIFVSAMTEKLDEMRETRLLDSVSKLKKFYLVCGYSEVADLVAKKLNKSGHDIVVMDTNPEHLTMAKNAGFLALDYDSGRRDSYLHTGIDFKNQVQSVLCLQEDDIQNVYTTLTIRSLSKDTNIIATLMSKNNRKHLQLAGVNEIVYAQELVGMIAREMSGKPAVLEAIQGLYADERSIAITKVIIDQAILDKFDTIGSLNMKQFHILFLGVQSTSSEAFHFNPVPSTLLTVGDRLIVVGQQTFLEEFENFIHRGGKHA